MQYDEYLRRLRFQERPDLNPEVSLVYLDEMYSQAILLTNLLMWDSVKSPEKKTVLKPFLEYVGLEDVDEFRLIIRTDIQIDVQRDYNDDFSGDFATGEQHLRLLKNLDLPTKSGSSFTESYLERLKKCATAWHEYEDDSVSGYLDSDDSLSPPSYLMLDYKVNKATKEAFQFHFEDNPLKLFQLFQLLLAQDLHHISIENKKKIYTSQDMYLGEDTNWRPDEDNRILRFKDFHIKKKGLSHTIYTKALSDGEHQFLHSLGLCLLFKDTRSLFLLDEPETHFNPDWKAKFITSLRSCFNKEEDSEATMRDILITTHSPFLISDSRMEYVHIFKKDSETGKVPAPLRPQFQTFGTSINKIGIRIFGMPHTIGEYAQKRLKEYEEEMEGLEEKEELEALILRVEKEMGDSVERVLFINQILDKIEGK